MRSLAGWFIMCCMRFSMLCINDIVLDSLLVCSVIIVLLFSY